MQIRHLLSLALLLFALPLHAQKLPDNGLPIQDNTGTYASNIKAVEQAIKAYGLPVKVLLTEPTEQNIDAYSHYLFKEWALPKDGLLICIFPTSRKVALTAGPELEAKGINGAFFRDTVIPQHFKPGWKSGGVVEAVKTSLTAIKLRLNTSGPTAPRKNHRNGFTVQEVAGRVADAPTEGGNALVLVSVFVILCVLVGIVFNQFHGADQRRIGNAGITGDTSQTVNYSNSNSSSSSVDNSSTSFDSGASSGGDCGGFSDTGSGDF